MSVHHTTLETNFTKVDLTSKEQKSIKDFRAAKHKNARKKSTRKSSPLSKSSANEYHNVDERNNNQSCDNNISNITVNDNILLEKLDDCSNDMSINDSKHDVSTTWNYDAREEHHNNINTTSTIANGDVATNASVSTSAISNNNVDDDCVTNSSRTIGLESTHNEIELWLFSSS